MNVDEFQTYIASMSRELKKAVNRDIPKKVGMEAASLFRQNFQNEGFFGKRWKEVNRRRVVEVSYRTKSGKRKTKYRTAGKGAFGRRKILTGATGDLGRSIKYSISGQTITVYSDLKYSRAHNDGTSTAGRGNTTNIPTRKFIGDHKKLQKAVNDIITKKINKIIQKK